MTPPAEGSVLSRGELWWADLPEPVGSEPGYRRPVLIIQVNRFNRSRLATVVAVSVTANIALADMPGNVFLSMPASGLDEDSVVNVTQIITVDRTFLKARIGTLPNELMRRVEAGLRLIQGL